MNPLTMKAAVLRRTGEPLTIESGIEVPALVNGQVLVRIAYSGVCHSQVMEARGRRGEDKYLPHLMGHEATGTVIECGPGVTKVKPGQSVVLTWIKSEGIEAPGAIYMKGGVKINSGRVTTFNEYSVVSESRVVALPEDMPMDVGSLLGCAVLTGAGIVTNDVQPRDGSSIAVFGLGGIGTSALMALALYKCPTVIAIDVEEAKLALASEFGATHTIDASKENPVARIREITGGAGVDYAVEASGQARTIEQAFESVRRGGGECVFATHPAEGSRVCIDPFELICGKRIRGSWGGDSRPDRDIPKFAALYKEGRLPLGRLISHRYSLDEVNRALDDIEARRVSRALLVIAP